MALILLLSPLWLHQCLVEDNTTLSTIWFIKNKIWKKKITCSIPQRFCSYYFFSHKLVPFDNIIFYFHQNIHNRYPIPWHIETKWRIYVSNLTIIGSDNGLSPGQHQAIIWTNAGISLTGPLRTNFSVIFIEIHIFSFKKMYLEIPSAKWRPFCLGLNKFHWLWKAHTLPHVGRVLPFWRSSPRADWSEGEFKAWSVSLSIT